MSDIAKNLVLWVIIALVLMMVFRNFGAPSVPGNVPYSQFVSSVKSGRVESVTIEGNTINGKYTDGSRFSTYSPETSNEALIGTLLDNNVEIKGHEPNQNSFWAHAFISWFPILLLLGIWIYFMRQMQGGGGGRGALSFGKSRARLLGEDQVRITFADVAGVEEAKEEVAELVEFLRDPGKFQKLGGKIPSGVLMVGPPGTGKTLLAKAIAGEARVPFFTISGSDFVEMFIDEIDAVGRHRGAGLGGGHDEREQTLNQLLVEMDGFEGNEGIIVIAATNRPDVLDPALLRPGRFDRQVVVPLPDIRGREQILKVHMRKVAVADDINPSIIARGTPGFSGADLANLVNEAALFAARANKKYVAMEDFERAKDKVMMGAERRSMVMSEEEKKLTAYHESGHAIVGRMMPGHDPVYKVTIIPRGRALGLTMFLPEEDRLSYSRRYLESQLCSLFGGRIAEQLVFGEEAVTTGASNDIQRATEIARNMVTKWGLSQKLGPLTYGEDEGEVFLGHSVTKHKGISDETAHVIDEEVRNIIDTSYTKAEKILKDNLEKLHIMAEALIKYETLESHQIDDIMDGQIPRPPAGWDDDNNPSGKPQPARPEGAAPGNVRPSDEPGPKPA
ncbi:MAG: ATP-dependent metallopeptidase FtsH/Yme1/Tma family protein [Gammaproteobacteria bacterium]